MDIAIRFKPGQESETLLHRARAATPFRSPSGAAWLSVPTGPTSHTALPLPSRAAELWLSASFFTEFDRPPSPWAIRRAIHTLEARALYHGPVRPVARRLAATANKIVIDLANEASQTVEITPAGWSLTDGLECSFERGPQTAPLPEPQVPAPDSTPLEDLRDLLGVTTGAQWTRILVWLLAAVRPVGPYPILIVDGPPASGKSTLAHCLKSVLDPGSASQGRILIYGQDSGPVRNLAAIAENTPVIWIGPAKLSERIEGRSLCVTLEHRALCRTRSSILRQFEALLPALLGSVFTAASLAMARCEESSQYAFPRLADVCAWGVAAAPALGLTPQEILAAISPDWTAPCFISVATEVETAPLAAAMSSGSTQPAQFSTEPAAPPVARLVST